MNLVSIFLLLFILPPSVFAACTLSLNNFTTPIDFTANQNPGGTTFRVRKSNASQSCNFFVGFTKGNTVLDYNRKLFKIGEPSYSIDFNLRKTNNLADPVLKTYPDTVLNTEVYVSSFSPGPPLNQTFTYYPSTTSWSTSNNLRFGTHTNTVAIQVFESSFPPGGPVVPEATANITYNYTVAKNALVSLLDVGQPYSDPAVATKTLTFSTMTLGQTVSFDMVLIYNAGYSVSFQSTNGQKMKHQTLNVYVPYTISMTGVPVFPSLTGGGNVVVTTGSGLSPSAPSGDRRTTTFTLGSTSGAFAGSYSDSILITMTSTE